MRVSGFLKGIVGIAGASALVAAPVISAIYALPKQKPSKRLLRKVINGKNSQNLSFTFRKTDGFGSMPSGEINAYSHTYISGLMKTVGTNENIKVATGIGPDKKVIYEKASGKHAYSEKAQLELAEAILYTDSNGQFAFLNDEAFISASSSELKPALKAKYSSYQIHRISSDQFLQILDAPSTTEKEVQLVIREGVKWSDNNGNETKYELKAEDFYYSLLHTGLSNNRNRNNVWNANDNPFGGHGSNGGVYPDDKNYPATIEMSKELDEYYKISKFFNKTSGYSNEYLFSLFGMTTPSELVLSRSGTDNGVDIPSDPHFMGNFNGKNTIRFTASKDSSFGSGIQKVLLDSMSLIPAPSEYIKENLADKNVGSINIPDGFAKKTGFYTYGQRFTDNLYIGAYTVTESNQFRARYEQNPNYWDKQWLENKDTVEQLLLEYSENSDQNIFSQSSYFQFKNDRVYSFDFATASPAIRRELEEDSNKFGVRYSSPYNSSTFVADLVPSMSIESGHDPSWYFLSDDASKLWYGTELQEVIDGNQSFSTYMKPESVQFRSLVNAATNYYSLTNFLYPDGSREVWTSYMPPDTKTSGKAGAKTLYEYKDDLTDIYYFSYENSDYVKNVITAEENKEAYLQNVDDASKQKYSSAHDKIKKEMKELLDRQNVGPNEKISIKIPERNSAPTQIQQNAAKQMVDAINDLDPRLDFEYLYDQSISPWYSNIIKLNGIQRFGGWTADYNSVGSMITGLSSYGSMIPMTGYIDFKRLLPSMSITDVNAAISAYESAGGKFSNLSRYGLEFSNWFDTTLQNEASRLNISSGTLALMGDVSDVANMTNETTSFAIGAKGIMTKLFDSQGISTSAQKAEYQKLVPFLTSALPRFDFEYFENSQDQQVIDTISEIRMLMGGAKGWIGNDVPTRDGVTPIVFRNDLLVPILTNGITYLSQWRVNQDRAQNATN